MRRIQSKEEEGQRRKVRHRNCPVPGTSECYSRRAADTTEVPRFKIISCQRRILWHSVEEHNKPEQFCLSLKLSCQPQKAPRSPFR